MARAPRSDGLARDRYLATQAWLDTVPGSLYAAQLLTAADTDLSWVDTYLIRAARAIDPGQLHLYSVRLGGRQWYRVAYGQYGTAPEAAEAVARMPESLRQFRPYAETVDVMRRTNATAE